jgi:hypothetical protein
MEKVTGKERNKMKNIVSLMAVMFISVNAFCSSPDSTGKMHDTAVKPPGTLKSEKLKVYRINYFVEGAIIAVGMAGDLIAIPRLKSKPSLTPDELTFANSEEQKNLINSMDK